MRHNNRRYDRWWLPALLLLAAAVMGTAYLLLERRGAEGPPGQTPPVRPPTVMQPEQTMPMLPPEQTIPPETTGQTTPDETTEPEETAPHTDPDEGFEAWDPPAVEDPPAPTQPAEPIQTEGLRCRQYARFSGQYAEDGRDELVENVAAILVTNQTDQFLDLATLTYDIDGQIAEFIVTGLPAGRSAWVMEASRLTVSDSAVFTHVQTVTSFREAVTAATEDISLYADANLLTAVNNTDRTLEDVFVYYKTLHTDGNFFGGITYRVDFGTLEPGASAQTLAGHYRSGETELVRIGWAGQ